LNIELTDVIEYLQVTGNIIDLIDVDLTCLSYDTASAYDVLLAAE